MIELDRQLHSTWPPDSAKNNDLAYRLRTQAWLSDILLQSGLSVSGLVRKLSEIKGSKNYNLPKKWKKGINITKPTMEWVSNAIAPESKDIYNLPLYELLSNRKLSSRKIRRLIQPYEKHLFGSSKFPSWSFPNDKVLLRHRRLTLSFLRDDTESLFQRGDIYGFIAILAILREAEAKGDLWKFISALRDAYRCIPSLSYNHPWEDYTDIITQCVCQIHFRSIAATSIMGVDTEILKQQVESEFEPKRELRKRDPRTKRFIELEDPTFLYQEEYEKIMIKLIEIDKNTITSE